MPTIPERLETATAKVETDAQKLRDIVQGAPGTVATEGGNVDTIAKVIADADAALAAAVSDLEESASASATAAAASAATASTHAGTATTKATEASASASTATTKASEALASANTATTKASEATASAAAAATSESQALAHRNGAESAKNAAEAARDAAQGSQTAAAASATEADADRIAAQTARTGAESARDASQAARDLAQSYRDTASTHATTATTQAGVATTQASAASSSASAALSSQNAAAASATAALNSQNAAASSASAASTSQSAASASAAAAASSQTAAAASAATALAVASGLTYQGVLAAASLPGSSTAGFCWLVSTGGTIHGQTFATNDLAIYRTTNTYDRIPAANLLGIQLPLVNSRRTTDGFFSDGTTSGRRITWNPGSIAAVGGLPVTILCEEYEVPTTNPPSTAGLWAWNSDSALGDAVWGIQLLHLSSGTLMLRQFGVTINDQRIAQFLNFGSTYAGRTVRIAVVISAPGTTTTPTLYIDGVDVTASFGGSTAGTTVPDWFSSSSVLNFFHAMRFMHTGRVGGMCRPILGTLTAAEVLTWSQTGRLPSWCETVAGNVVDRSPTGRSATFGAADGASTYTPVGSGGGSVTQASVLGARTGGAGARVLELTSGGVNSFVELSDWSIPRGVKFYFSVWARRTVGAATTLFIGDLADSSNRNSVAGLSGSWQRFTGEAWGRSTNLNGLNIGFSSAAANEKIEIDDLQISFCGPFFRPEIRSGRVLPDLSGNRVNGYLYGGLFALTGEYRGLVIQNALTANGEFIDTTGTIPTDAVIEDVVVRNTTANQVSGFALGSASGGDQVTHRTDIPGNTTVVLPIRQAAAATLTAGTYVGQLGSVFGRLYYSALTWNSGSLNVSIRYRRERGI